MADRYVTSVDGSNSDDGTTRALAKADLAGVTAIDTAGDRIFAQSTHNETTATAITHAYAGTQASPTKVISNNWDAEPPTAVTAGATVSTTASASNITITGFVWQVGMNYSAGNSTNQANINLGGTTAGETQHYDGCEFRLNNSHASSAINVGNGSGAVAQCYGWRDSDVKFGNASQIINVNNRFEWDDGEALSGTTSPTVLFRLLNRGEVHCQNVDFSNFGTAFDFFNASGTQSPGPGLVRNCRLPASWAGDLLNGTPVAGFRAELFNCDYADTNLKVIRIQDSNGELRDESTIIKGAEAFSWKIITSSVCSYPLNTFVSGTQRGAGEIDVEITAAMVGVSKTVTVSIIHDSVTNLKDNEVWLEGSVPTTSGVPLYVRVTDCAASVLTTGADQTSDSGASWTTTGLTNPNKQALAITFTPQEVGMAHFRIVAGIASKTLYASPFAVVS